MPEPIIDIVGLENRIGDTVIHQNLDLQIQPGEIVAIIGASGCGKTTLLRAILKLHRPSAGVLKVFGTDITRCSHAELQAVRQRWGMMFQGGALFSSLNVLDNIAFPLKETLHYTRSLRHDVAALKLAMVGLDRDAGLKFPAELSGGMKKRAAMARAIALDPELLFLDEPSAGLDPQAASDLDGLILSLRDTLGLTVVMVTHDLDTLWRVPDRIIFMGEKKVLSAVSMAETMRQEHPLITEYFSGERAQGRIPQ